MSAPSLYRRHRPRTFSDVVGQEHVVRTLRNAIEQGKVHHAYLFVGSRGTGKTSMAKILAAALNCEHGPTVDPCGACESCTSIAGASSLDVVEMDAASNNSVDDIRELREKVAFAPVSGRSKVYILDEAHMLSTAAWNAFLKTLEEPPPNTVFVLATTEANKVLPTVVDRCHRFDFGRPTVVQIAAVLRRVAEAEGIAIGDDALALVARSATGSFRDALGTLEQLVAYARDAIALADVLAVLGVADDDLTFGAVDAVSAGDVAGALRAAAGLAESGRDVGRFFSDLEAHARALMVVQSLGGALPAELSLTPEHDARLIEQAGRVGPADVVRLLDLIALGLRAMKDGSEARTQLELCLVKAAAPHYDPSVRALLARIERLEGGVPAHARPIVEPVQRDPACAQTAAARAQEPVAAVQEPAPAAQEPAPAVQEPAPAVQEPVAAVQASPPVHAPAAPSPGPVPVPPGVPADLAAVADVWQAVVDAATQEKPLLGAILAEARPAALAGHELTLAWPHSAAFSKRKAEEAACREAVARAVRTVTGAQVSLAFELRDGAELPGRAGPGLSEAEAVARLVAELGAQELPPDPPVPATRVETTEAH